MKQCVDWTSSMEFDKLRTEITLSSCTSIACTCISRVEPKHEAEWVTGDSIRTELNGSCLTKEEIDKYGSHLEKLTSQTTESIIERTENPFLTNSTEDELTQSDELDVEQQLRTRARGDSIYVTSATLEQAKNVAKNLLHKNKDRNARSDQPSRITASVDTSYTQIWMCGRDKKKGLLAVFILPDDQKNIFVSASFQINSFCINCY